MIIKRYLMLLSIFTILTLPGCGGLSSTATDIPASTADISDIIYEDLDYSLLEAISSAATDNTMDSYAATIREKILSNNKGTYDEIGRGAHGYILGKNRASIYTKHLYTIDDSIKSWDEISYATDDKIRESVQLNYQQTDHNQIWCSGSIWNSDHYMMYTLEAISSEAGNSEKHVFFETDENLTILHKFDVDFLPLDSIVVSLMVDSNSDIHLLVSSEANGIEYYIMNETGKKIFYSTYSAYSTAGLRSLNNGQVGLQVIQQSFDNQPSNLLLYQPNFATNSLDTIASVPYQQTYNPSYPYDPAITMWDESTVLMADNHGVFLCNTNGIIKKTLYLWSNHGVTPGYIANLRRNADDTISILCEYPQSYEYIKLEKVSEKSEITEICLAVTPANKNLYWTAARAFNQDHPAFHIEIKDDYDESALLTELISGNGPVMVDTSLTGFENCKNLWQPLGAIFRELGLEDELLKDVMELGIIDQRMYGVISSFYLETIVTKAGMPHWDYNQFLKALEQLPDSAYAYNNLYEDSTAMIARFFTHGLADNYLFDPNTHETIFSTPAFHDLLELTQKYNPENQEVEPGNLWPEGNVLCNRVIITNPIHLEAYRTFYGEDLNYIGYPSYQGSGHYIYSLPPLALRSTATTSEKAVAIIFMKYLLSYEVQRDASNKSNFFMSVRKDVLEEQINDIVNYQVVQIAGFPAIKVKDPDPEACKERLYDLIAKASPCGYFPKELNAILMNELEDYYCGLIPEKMLIDHLENRIGLFLNEQ